MKSSDIKTEITPLKRLSFNGDSIKLTIPNYVPENAFLDILESRRSRYEFKDLSAHELGYVLYFANRTKSTAENKWGQSIEYRNVASPGAMHSIYCFLKPPSEFHWYCYDSQNHSLNKQNVEPCSKFISNAYSLLKNSHNGWLIWYVCDLDLLGSKYENPLPLAYRDCGGIATTQHLVCEAFKFNYTQLGISGHNQAQVFSEKRKLVGLGTALIAGRPSS